MAVFNDVVTTTVTIDGNQAVNQLGKLQSEIAGLNQQLQATGNESKKLVLEQKKVADSIKQVTEAMAQMAAEGKQDTDEYKRMSAEMVALNKKKKTLSEEIKKVRLEEKLQTDEIKKSLEQARKASDTLREKLGLQGMNLKQLKTFQKELNFEMSNTIKGSNAYDTLKAKIQAVSKAINDQQADIKDTRTAWEKMKGSVREFGVVAAGVVGGEIITGLWSALSGFVMNVTKGAADLADQFSDIQKTTGMTADEVKALNSELSKIDTRTSSKDLREIAKVGGQIGIAKDEMLGFVESVNMATVALGDEFTGGAEEVAKEIGILKNLFEETKNLKAGDAISQIGSAMNALGAAGSATAPEIGNFAKRIGTLGNLGPNISQTLGLGAAMQELGLSAEISSGGLTSLFLTAGNESKAFAAQIGISEEAFKNLMNTDPNEMLMQLAQSFQGLDNDEVIAALSRMKVGSQEAIKVMSLLANQTDLVKQKQALAAEEMKKNTSLRDEATLKENNFAGQLAKTEKIINGFVASISQGLIPVMTSLLSTFVFLIEGFKALPKFLSDNKQWFIALGVALVTFNAQAIIANAQLLLMNARMTLVATGTKAWAVAQRILNVVLIANPIGAVITLVAALAAGIYTAYERAGTFTGALKGIWAMMEVLGAAFGKFMLAVSKLDFSAMKDAFSGIGEKMLYEFDLASGKRFRDAEKANADKAKAERDKRIDDEQNERWKALGDQANEESKLTKANQEKINKARQEALAKGDSEATKQRAESMKKQKDELDKFVQEIKTKMEDDIAIMQAKADDMNAVARNIFTPKARTAVQKAYDSSKQNVEAEQVDESGVDKFNKSNRAGKELAYIKAQAAKNAELILSSKIDLLNTERDIELQNTDLTENEKALIREKYRQQEIELTKQAEQAKYQAAIDIANQGLDIAKGFIDARFGLEEANAENEKRTKTQKLEEEYAQGLITKQEYEDAKNGIDQESEKKIADIKTRQARAEKAFNIATAVVNTAQAILKALASTAPPLNFILAGAVGAVGAVQIAKIISTPIPDYYSASASAGGGGGGAATGGYADGGYTGKGGKYEPAGIVHRGEYVIPAHLLQTPVVANYAGVIEAMRTGRSRGYAEGGAVGTSIATALPSPDQTAMLLDAISTLNSLLSRGLKAYVVASEIQDGLNELDRIDDEARFI